MSLSGSNNAADHFVQYLLLKCDHLITVFWNDCFYLLYVMNVTRISNINRYCQPQIISSLFLGIFDRRV